VKKKDITLVTDSYKAGHWRQYPPGTTRVFSFFESRGGKFPETTMFGLQYILREYMEGQVVTEEGLRESEAYFAAHFGNPSIFNAEGWRYILEHHGGRLPLEIRAIPEGTPVKNHNALMTIVNTDPKVPWLVNYMETLLCQLWYPSTVCSQSRAMKQVIGDFLVKTGDPSLLPFKLHDFGYRGSTSVESAGLGAAAHLVNFKGTDTLAGVDLLREYYGEPMAGFSIPASEHSTITSWGREHEVDAYANMLEQFKGCLFACVSDSYDIYDACRNLWGKELREKVLAHKGGLVVRPDSGNPIEVVPKVIGILGERFGFSDNEKGYQVLNPAVRVIQGDGITFESMRGILEAVACARYSTDNIAFGSGGGLLQLVDRDTQKFAFKACAAEVNGEWRDVYKQPVTDPGKNSKRGRLALVKRDGRYLTTTYEGMLPDEENELKVVFRDGRITLDWNLSQIRERAEI
jgi:nicotinamide phosphoribosyltransferase